MASPFSGKAGRLAAMWAANQQQQGLGQITNTLSDAEQRAGGYLTQGYGVGRDVLGTGYADMMDQLGTAYGAAPGQLTAGGDAARTALSDAGSLGIGSIREGRDQALNYGALADYQTQNNYAEAMQRMGQGFDRATGTLQGAAAGYDPLIEQGMRGYGMLGNALGLGGAEGTAAAQGAFQAGPGYQWNVDQATQAAQRAANRTGGGYGGNTLDAVTRLGSNLANQEYGNWIRNLQPYQGAATAAVGGKAGVLGNLSQMQALQGTSMAGLDTAEAAARNEILRNQGNIYTTAGNQIANLQRGTGQDIARLECRPSDEERRPRLWHVSGHGQHRRPVDGEAFRPARTAGVGSKPRGAGGGARGEFGGYLDRDEHLRDAARSCSRDDLMQKRRVPTPPMATTPSTKTSRRSRASGSPFTPAPAPPRASRPGGAGRTPAAAAAVAAPQRPAGAAELHRAERQHDRLRRGDRAALTRGDKNGAETPRRSATWSWCSRTRRASGRRNAAIPPMREPTSPPRLRRHKRAAPRPSTPWSKRAKERDRAIGAPQHPTGPGGLPAATGARRKPLARRAEAPRRRSSSRPAGASHRQRRADGGGDDQRLDGRSVRRAAHRVGARSRPSRRRPRGGVGGGHRLGRSQQPSTSPRRRLGRCSRNRRADAASLTALLDPSLWSRRSSRRGQQRQRLLHRCASGPPAHQAASPQPARGTSTAASPHTRSRRRRACRRSWATRRARAPICGRRGGAPAAATPRPRAGQRDQPLRIIAELPARPKASADRFQAHARRQRQLGASRRMTGAVTPMPAAGKAAAKAAETPIPSRDAGKGVCNGTRNGALRHPGGQPGLPPR